MEDNEERMSRLMKVSSVLQDIMQRTVKPLQAGSRQNDLTGQGHLVIFWQMTRSGTTLLWSPSLVLPGIATSLEHLLVLCIFTQVTMNCNH